MTMICLDRRAERITTGMDVVSTLRRVDFASCYVYSPWGPNPASERSRLLRSLLKERDPHFIRRYALRVQQQVHTGSVLRGYLEPGDVLVPVPGSVPRSAIHPSVAQQLAFALLEMGLGARVWMGLRRVAAVQKSATAAPGSRPTVSHHYESFAVEAPQSLEPHVLRARIVLVDDVVTKGRTLLAAAMRLQESFPAARIRAFALLRTMGFASGVDQLLEPCVGEIRWRGGDAQRSP